MCLVLLLPYSLLQLKTTAAEREALGLTTETAPEVLVRLSYAEATSHLEHINHHITMDLKVGQNHNTPCAARHCSYTAVSV